MAPNKTLVCEELNDCLQNEQLPGSETSASGFYEKQIPFVAQLLQGTTKRLSLNPRNPLVEGKRKAVLHTEDSPSINSLALNVGGLW